MRAWSPAPPPAGMPVHQIAVQRVESRAAWRPTCGARMHASRQLPSTSPCICTPPCCPALTLLVLAARPHHDAQRAAARLAACRGRGETGLSLTDSWQLSATALEHIHACACNAAHWSPASASLLSPGSGATLLRPNRPPPLPPAAAAAAAARFWAAAASRAAAASAFCCCLRSLAASLSSLSSWGKEAVGHGRCPEQWKLKLGRA